MQMIVCFLCFFFLFKQKTAYEMRISDWSSDVCSSDLGIGGADGGMMIERIERAFGRRDHLDPEAVEKRARTEGVGRQRVGDAVVIKVRRLGRELHVESERLGEHPVHPHPRRGAAKEMIILREDPQLSRGSAARFRIP